MKNLIFIPVLAASALAATVHINQAGYDAASPKSLVVESAADLQGAEYTISNGSVSEVGTFGLSTTPADWSIANYYSVDFSKITEPGDYIISFIENGVPQNFSFTVKENAMAEIPLNLVLNYFRNDRDTKNRHASVTVYGTSEKKDVHGGWYDASGDFGKYLSHLSYANYLNPQQIPLTTWSLAFASERIPNTVAKATLDANFASDEAIFGADFLMRMLSDEGYFYMTVFNGWNATSSHWYLCAFSGSEGIKSSDYQAAFREGGGMAIAALARVAALSKNGEYSSEEYLAAAERAFEHLQSKQTIGGACAYCDDGVENIIDDYTALLAACELYNATKKNAYLEVARARAIFLSSRISEDGYFWSDSKNTRPFFHASDAGLPLVALVRYLELETEESMAHSIASAAKKHLQWMLAVTDRKNNPFGYAKQTYKTGGNILTRYFIPHDNESGYWWQGENARLGSLASAAVYASRILGYADSTAAFGYAADQVDWILGKNPFDVSFMKGVGKNNPRVYQDYSASTLVGGVANGITAKNTDGTGIVWDDYAAAGLPLEETWQYWRFVEQWLPHATWFMMALATRYDEVPVPAAAPLKNAAVKVANKPVFDIKIYQNTLYVSVGKSKTTLLVADFKGRNVLARQIAGNETLDLSILEKGVYIVKIKNLFSRKIVIK